MKFVISTLSSLSQFTVYGALFWQLAFAVPARAEAVTLLALGDSLTAGYGLVAGEGFTDQLQAKIDEALGPDAVRIINGGVSGDTTRGGLARLDWALFDNPDMVMVALGGNDMLRGLEPSESLQNLEAILARLEQENKQVLLAGMLAPANMGADYQRAFDDIYPTLAARYDVVYYPFFLDGVALEPRLNQPDGLHPNQQGVAVMTDNIMPYIMKLIAKTSQD